MMKFDDDYLDTLMADLEKAKDSIQSKPNDFKKPNLNKNYSTTKIEESPNRKTMTTTTKYEYTKHNTNIEPLYQNSVFNHESFEKEGFKKASSASTVHKKYESNINNLNQFFDDINHSKKKNEFNKNEFNIKESNENYEQYDKSYIKSKSSETQKVNNLISSLERNLANPIESLKWRGEQIKPITMTEYYEESKKTSYINNPSTDNQKANNAQYSLPIQSNEMKSAVSSSNQYHSFSKYNNNYTSNITDSSSSIKKNQYNVQNKQTRASNATNELDDLMASLTDFRIKDTSKSDQIESNIESKNFRSNQQQFKKQQFNENEQKKQYEQHKQQQQHQKNYYQKQFEQENQKKFYQHQQKEETKIIENSEYAICKPRNQREISYSSSNKTRNKMENRELNNETKKNIENNKLDNLIGSIEIKLNKEGINTSAKGSCYACNKSVIGQVITALGRIYHPEHFTCAHCNVELGERTFFERNGKCYCELDYHNLFAPKCSYCTAPITGRQKCVSALNQTFHAEHFFCAECGSQFTEEKGYHEQNNQAYCSDCYLNVIAQKCTDCNKPIISSFISALGSQWHPECFVCTQCKCEFASGAFFEYEGRPYCETHFHAKKSTLCAGCHKPITGRSVTAMFRKFHPEHFVCSFCLKQLNKGTFKEQNDKPYCHNCFEKLFG